jgi:hypothetical protein
VGGAKIPTVRAQNAARAARSPSATAQSVQSDCAVGDGGVPPGSRNVPSGYATIGPTKSRTNWLYSESDVISASDSLACSKLRRTADACEAVEHFAA